MVTSAELDSSLTVRAGEGGGEEGKGGGEGRGAKKDDRDGARGIVIARAGALIIFTLVTLFREKG